MLTIADSNAARWRKCRIRELLAIAAVLVVPSTGAAAAWAQTDAQHATGQATTGLLIIGSTAIPCVEALCPDRRGIAPIAGNGEPATPLWFGGALPPLVADKAQRRRIEAAWENQQCLIVEGSFDGRTLTVAHIVEEC